MSHQQTLYIVTLAIFNKKQELLLVRKKGSIYFQLPGGKRQEGEEDSSVLIRELREELNLSIDFSELMFLGNHQAKAVNEANTLVVGRMYCLNAKEGLNPTTDSEIEEMIWVNPSNYLTITWANLVKEFIFPIWKSRNNLI